MSQQDYSSLVSQSVDVKSTMSYEMSAAMSSSQGVKVGAVKALGESLSGSLGAFDDPRAKAAGASIGAITSVVTGGKDESAPLFGEDVTENSSSSLSQFARNRKEAEDALKISKTKKVTKEYTIGG